MIAAMGIDKDTIIRQASRLGFSQIGFTAALPSPQLDAYLSWITAGMQGEMAYMARPDRVARYTRR